ncbi:MAG: transcriptional regulator NrdR family protein [Paraglaciecola sp.]|jgi:transcriptional regulator NrdR family protein
MCFHLIKMIFYSTYTPVFNENKLRSGFLIMPQKRPVNSDLAVKDLIRKLIATGEREVPRRFVEIG